MNRLRERQGGAEGHETPEGGDSVALSVCKDQSVAPVAQLFERPKP